MPNDLKVLAESLILNHLSVSLGPKSAYEINNSEVSLGVINSSKKKIYERNVDYKLRMESLRRKYILHKRVSRVTQKKIVNSYKEVDRRVVLVVGAGASFGLHDAMLAPDAAESIKKKLGLDSGVGKSLFETQIKKLAQASKHRREDFETQLLACSILCPTKTITEVQNMYNMSYVPSYGYEIIAHLFKHRYVDAIIDFNFDELLDESICCELPNNDYYRIISDGDIPNKKYAYSEITHRWDKPIYIKPHGTISHPTSLKFTDEHYYSIHEKITGHIGTYFEGLPVTVWCIGFGMQSFEFNNIIETKTRRIANTKYYNHLDQNMVHKNSEIIFMDVDDPINRAWENNREIDIGIFNDNDKRRCIKIKKRKSENLNSKIKKIWSEITDNFPTNQFKPVGITRHSLLVNALEAYKEKEEKNRKQALAKKRKTTHNDTKSEQEIRKKLYLNRFYLELGIAIAKAKGVVNINELSQGRPGYFLKKYMQESNCVTDSLYQFCRMFGLKKIGYSREILKLDNKSNRSKKYLIRQLADTIYDKIKDFFVIDGEPYNLKDILKDYLYYIFKGREVEVTTKTNIGRVLFKAPIVIPTFTSLSYFTRIILRNPDWSVLLSVAETGEWLLFKDVEKFIKKGNRRICLITAQDSLTTDNTVEDKLLKMYGKRIEIRSIPWLEHNNHMTLLLTSEQKRNKEVCKPLSSIFFIRRLQAPHIEPLLLNSSDSFGVLDTFVTYWAKANANDKRVYYENDMIKDQKNKLKDRCFGEKSIWEKRSK